MPTPGAKRSTPRPYPENPAARSDELLAPTTSTCSKSQPEWLVPELPAAQSMLAPSERTYSPVVSIGSKPMPE
ncbi:MAG: hypothetical protein RIS86_210 [Planctomycetota bacterium]